MFKMKKSPIIAVPSSESVTLFTGIEYQALLPTITKKKLSLRGSEMTQFAL